MGNCLKLIKIKSVKTAEITIGRKSKVEKWEMNNDRLLVWKTASRDSLQGSMLKPSGSHALIKAGEEINLVLFKWGKINLNWFFCHSIESIWFQ